MAHKRYASCIQACSACAIACETCAAACLKEPDLQHMAICIACDIDCADICRLAERLMVRDSPLCDEFLRLCAVTCPASPEECSHHPHDHSQQCAQACQRCVVECEVLAA